MPPPSLRSGFATLRGDNSRRRRWAARCENPFPVLSSLPLDYIVVRLCLSGLPPVLILCCGFDTRPLGDSHGGLVGWGPISPALLSSGAPIPRSLSPAPDGRALRASGRAVAPQAAHIFCRLRTAPQTAASLQSRQAGRALEGVANVAVRQAGETSRCVGGQRTVPGAAGSIGPNCAPRGLAVVCGAGLSSPGTAGWRRAKPPFGRFLTRAAFSVR